MDKKKVKKNIEESSGAIAIDLRKAVYCYQKTQSLGIDTAQDILRIKNIRKRTN